MCIRDRTNTAAIALTFTASEATTNFVSGDITVSGCSIGSTFAATSSTVYTATCTASSDGTPSVSVAADKFSDAVGNANSAASNTYTWTYDGTAPTMTIASSTVSSGASTNTAAIVLSFTSSEATTNFVSGDITVSGLSLIHISEPTRPY